MALAPLSWPFSWPWAGANVGRFVTVAPVFARTSIRWLSAHTGLPALVVAAVLVLVGYRLAKRSARFLAQLAVVAAALAAATQLGWIRW